MIIKRVEQSPVTTKELNLYKEKISKLNTFMCTALDVGMDKRIITLKFGGEYEDLTLVNPKVLETSDDMVMYVEKDSVKNKNRKTIRHKSFKVDTDNLGVVEFSSDKDKWDTNDDFFNDMGLFECIMAQRLIDSIDGIDITNKNRAYNVQLKAEKTPGRNERVMVQSPDGEMEFMKYKKALPLLQQGYQLV